MVRLLTSRPPAKSPLMRAEIVNLSRAEIVNLLRAE